MFITIIPLVLIVMALAGLSRACSFSPGGPTEGPPLNVDVAAELRTDAAVLDFPVRLPQLPPEWHGNSASRGEVSGPQGGPSATVGWMTGSGRYLRLVQSTAGEDALLASQVGGVRSASGTREAGGRSWVVYPEQDAEAVWVADLGDVRLLITGSGSAEDYQTLATAAAEAQPLNG